MTPPTTGRDKGRARREPGSRAATKPRAAGKPTASAKRTKKPDTPMARDIEIDADVLEFIEAIDRFKKDSGKPFPTWSEVLHVLLALGYRKAGGA